MKSFALLLFLIGLIMLVIGYTSIQIKCPPPRIEYRFVPRSFIEEQLSTNTLDAVNSMFADSDPFFLQDDVTNNKDKGSNFYSAKKTN